MSKLLMSSIHIVDYIILAILRSEFETLLLLIERSKAQKATLHDFNVMPMELCGGESRLVFTWDGKELNGSGWFLDVVMRML